MSRIHLLWDDGREEDLLISDLGDEVWGADGYTSCWSPENCLATGDYNFDGYATSAYSSGQSRLQCAFYYWFYDAQTDSFQPCKTGPISSSPTRKTRSASASGMPRPSITPTPTVPMGTAGCTSRGAIRRFITSADGVKSFTEVYAVNEQPLAYADLDRDGEYEILVLSDLGAG